MSQPKRIYLSRTVLVALVALIAAGLQAWKGWVLDPAIQLALVSVAMIGLRSITTGPVRFTVSGEAPVVEPFVPMPKRPSDEPTPEPKP